MKNSSSIFLAALVGSLVVIFLYAYSIKNTALEKSEVEVLEHQEVMYKALILESYTTFTYFVMALSLILGIVFITKSRISNIWLKMILGVMIFVAFTVANLVVYKWFF